LFNKKTIKKLHFQLEIFMIYALMMNNKCVIKVFFYKWTIVIFSKFFFLTIWQAIQKFFSGKLVRICLGKFHTVEIIIKLSWWNLKVYSSIGKFPFLEWHFVFIFSKDERSIFFQSFECSTDCVLESILPHFTHCFSANIFLHQKRM
jgi:hypothetical protein